MYSNLEKEVIHRWKMSSDSDDVKFIERRWRECILVYNLTRAGAIGRVTVPESITVSCGKSRSIIHQCIPLNRL